MLKSKDSHTIVGGVQMAHILMEKLPSIFLVLFHREGVVHEVRSLRDSPLHLLPTPRKDAEKRLGEAAGVATVPQVPPRQPPMATPPRGTPSSVGAGLAQATPPGPSHSSTRKYVGCTQKEKKQSVFGNGSLIEVSPRHLPLYL